MIKIPPYLKKGDIIGIVCPSGYMPYEKALACIKTLELWGYRVLIGKTLGSQFHYFSGTDAERLADLQDMLDNDQVKAILCGRGGYGMSRIIDDLNFTKFKKKPKWLIGFSDITVLQAHVFSKYATATLHAPMAGAFNEGEAENEFVQSLRQALKGKKSDYTANTHEFNRMGKTAGLIVGGNLSLVAHLIGSRSAFDTKGKILFLEDIGEYVYNIDRMFIQLKRSGGLQQLAGLIIGGFSEIKDTTIPFGASVFETIQAHVKEFSYPVCFDFPVSHEKNNYALKVGVEHQLTVTNKIVRLREMSA